MFVVPEILRVTTPFDSLSIAAEVDPLAPKPLKTFPTKLYVPGEVILIACPVLADPVKVLFSNITGDATEHHRLPAVTVVVVIVLFSMRVEALVVIESFPAGILRMLPASKLRLLTSRVE